MAAGWEWAWDYQQGFMLSQRVARYLKLFPAQQLFVRRYEELKNHPAAYYSDLCKFLGVSAIDLKKANLQVNLSPTRRDMIAKRKAGRWMLRSARVAGLLVPRSLKAALWQRTLGRPAFALGPDDQRWLIDHFADDINKTAQILSWDLSDWLKI
jgi:hypothetical protein